MSARRVSSRGRVVGVRKRKMWVRRVRRRFGFWSTMGLEAGAGALLVGGRLWCLRPGQRDERRGGGMGGFGGVAAHAVGFWRCGGGFVVGRGWG